MSLAPTIPTFTPASAPRPVSAPALRSAWVYAANEFQSKLGAYLVELTGTAANWREQYATMQATIRATAAGPWNIWLTRAALHIRKVADVMERRYVALDRLDRLQSLPWPAIEGLESPAYNALMLLPQSAIEQLAGHTPDQLSPVTQGYPLLHLAQNGTCLGCAIDRIFAEPSSGSKRTRNGEAGDEPAAKRRHGVSMAELAALEEKVNATWPQ